jgi:hypothetical protein
MEDPPLDGLPAELPPLAVRPPLAVLAGVDEPTPL